MAQVARVSPVGCTQRQAPSEWSGNREDGELTGPPLVELRGQNTGADPLMLLRALLSGQSA